MRIFQKQLNLVNALFQNPRGDRIDDWKRHILELGIMNYELVMITLPNIENNFKILSIVSMQTKSKKFCLLRSPHIDKDSREHFEIKNFKSFIDFEINSIKSLNDLLNIELINGAELLSLLSDYGYNFRINIEEARRIQKESGNLPFHRKNEKLN